MATYGKLRASLIKSGKKIIFIAQKTLRKAVTDIANTERKVTTAKAQQSREQIVQFGEKYRDRLERLLKPVRKTQRAAFIQKFRGWDPKTILSDFRGLNTAVGKIAYRI